MGDLDSSHAGDTPDTTAGSSLAISPSKLDIYRTAFTGSANDGSVSTTDGLSTRYIPLPDHHVLEAQAYGGNLQVRELNPNGRTIATYDRDSNGKEHASVLDPATQKLVSVNLLPVVHISQK